MQGFEDCAQIKERHQQCNVRRSGTDFYAGRESLLLNHRTEQISTTHLSDETNFRFQLPGDHPVIRIDIGQGEVAPDVVLHTLAIDMESRQLDMVWRAAIEYPGLDWLPEMRKLDVVIQ